MALTSLQNQFISASYGQLIQISGSELADGNGSSLSSSLLNTSASYALTASVALNVPQIDTGSFVTTASSDYSEITFTKADASTFNLDVTPRKVIETVKNGETYTLAKGTPVYVSGSQGNASIIYAASASVASKMPAAYVLNEQLAADAEGEGIAIGFINGVDTSTFTAGDSIYVGANGGYTNAKPTGTNLIQKLGNVIKSDANGSGVIFGAGRANDVPNIPQGQAWVGALNGVATPTNTSSFQVDVANTALDVTSSARLNITDITASNASFTSASIGYLTSVTGSAKIVGDAFIIVNNDTPTQRYAGIKVIDSGSASTTASLQFDGQENDWFYQYTGSDGTDFGVVMFGPEYSTIGSPTYLTNNRIPKGDGGHHLNDSIISDNGSGTVTVNGGTGTNFYINDSSNPVQYGNVQIYTNEDTYAANIYCAYQINNGGAGDFDIQLENTTYSGLDGSNPVMRLRGGANNGTDGNTIISSDTSNGYAKHHKQSVFLSPITASAAISGGAATFTVHGTSDFVKIDGNEQDALEVIGSVFMGSVNQRQNNPYNSFVQGEFNTIAGGAAGNSAIIGARASQINGSAQHHAIAGGLSNTISNSERSFIGGGDTNAVNADNAAIVGGKNNTISSTHTGSVILGGASITSTAADTVFVPNLDVSGSISVTGSAHFAKTATFDVSSISIASSTASMDCSLGNLFSFQLAAGVDTHLDATNIQAGQVINLKLTQNGTTAGTISFAPEFKFPSGVAHVASTGLNDVDVLTFIAFDSSNLLATGLSNFE